MNTKISYYDYVSINFDNLFVDLSRVNWPNCWNLCSVDEKLNWFMSIIKNTFDQHVLIKTYTKKSNTTPWFTQEVLKSIKERNKLHSRWKRNRSEINWYNYSRARNRANYIINRAKKKYFFKKLNSVLTTKELWSNIRHLGIFSQSKADCTLSPGDLSAYFSSESSSSTASHIPTFHSCSVQSPFEFVAVSENEVASNILSISSNAVGFDSMPIRFVKLILPFILPTLTHIINHSLTTSVFPSLWKFSIIKPIPKTGNPRDLKDFRPISILPALSKVFERILAQQITKYINTYNLLSPLQSGFREGRSCKTALLKVLEDVRIPFDNNQITFLCLLDFSKAFDCINHQLILQKLGYYFHFGISSIKLIGSYLSKRYQRVEVNSTCSDFSEINNGVPQGSTLGPLLFAMYLNDIFVVCNNAKIHAYTDDVQLYLSGNLMDAHMIIENLNEDLDLIAKWAVSNFLAINSNKSVVLPIYFRSLNLSYLPDICMNTI